MIYLEKPSEFTAKFEVVSCFLEREGKILLLLRQDHKPQGNTLGVPAGKVENGEDPTVAILRELKEETGHKIGQNDLNHSHKLFVKYSDYDFVYHIYHCDLVENINIVIDSKSHKDFAWVVPKEALNMSLIQDLDKSIELFYYKK